ncbi:MAG: hypothetical protein ACWA41_05225, partial [Putridiphycobacter sp.]
MKKIFLLGLISALSFAGFSWTSPSLASPTDGGSTWTGVTLDWYAVANSDFYQIELDTTSNFNSPIKYTNLKSYINTSSSNSDTREYVEDLFFGQTYYWRVRAMSGTDTSAWVSRSFITRDYVTLNTPTDGSSIWTGRTFDWYAHKGVDFYEIEVDTTTAFNSSVLLSASNAYINTSSSNSDTRQYFEDLYFGQTYYWRVRAINGVDTSAWEMQSVVTRDYVTLNTPTDGSSIWTGRTFDWYAHEGVDFYEIEVDTTTAFNSSV